MFFCRTKPNLFFTLKPSFWMVGENGYNHFFQRLTCSQNFHVLLPHNNALMKYWAQGDSFTNSASSALTKGCDLSAF